MWFRRHSLQQSLSASYKLDFLSLFFFSLFFLLRFHWQAMRTPASLLWQKCNLTGYCHLAAAWNVLTFWDGIFRFGLHSTQYTNVRIFTIKCLLASCIGGHLLVYQTSHQAAQPIVMSHRADFHNSFSFSSWKNEACRSSKWRGSEKPCFSFHDMSTLIPSKTICQFKLKHFLCTYFVILVFTIMT